MARGAILDASIGSECTLKYRCPCCGYHTLDSRPPGSYELCPVCWWEDDGVQFADPDLTGGANSVRLNQARRNFAAYGVCCAEGRAHVRPPTEEERGQ